MSFGRSCGFSRITVLMIWVEFSGGGRPHKARRGPTSDSAAIPHADARTDYSRQKVTRSPITASGKNSGFVGYAVAAWLSPDNEWQLQPKRLPPAFGDSLAGEGGRRRPRNLIFFASI